MPISTEATLLDIADRVRVELEIFPQIGQGGGLELIALSTFPLVGSALKRRILALSIDPRNLRKRPILGLDPCGYGLTLRPLVDQQKTVERLFNEPWDQVVSDMTIWSPMHLSHAVKVLQYLSRLCLYNGFDGAGAVEDATFKHRVWQITLLLRSASDFGPHFLVAYERAVTELESLHPGYRNRIHKNRFSGTIERKKPTSLEDRYDRLPRITRPVETRRLLLSKAAKEDETFYTLQSDLILAWREKGRKQSFTPFESEIASPGIPGEAEVRRVLAASRDRTDDPAAAVTKMIAATMLHPSQLLQAELQLFEGFAIVSTTANKYSSLNDFDPELHRGSSSPKFSRVVDATTASAYQGAIAGKSLDVLHVEVDRWLDSISENLTLSMLRVALLQNGPRWFSYPSAYAHHGLDGQQQSMKGWRYYCNFDLGASWSSIKRYQSGILGCEYATNFQPPRLANGSHCTPTDEILQSMTKTLRTLLDAPILGESLDETVCRHNGLVGILHQLVLGLSFLRNFPFEPPQLLPVDDGWFLDATEYLIYQKSLVVAEFPPLLQRLLIEVRTKFTDFSQALRAEGVELEFRGREFAAYGFWSLPYRYPRTGRLVTCWQEPCRWQSLNGLLHCPETEIYAGLHFNAMRHWTITTLLESDQFSLTEVNWLHGHGEGHLQPLSHHRLEPGNCRLRRRGFDFLADRLGLRQII